MAIDVRGTTLLPTFERGINFSALFPVVIDELQLLQIEPGI